MIKSCVVCGNEFDALGSINTCGIVCRDNRRLDINHEKGRRWYYGHLDAARGKSRRYNVIHRSERTAYLHKWHREHTDRVASYFHNRRVKLNGVPLTAEVVLELKAEYGGICPYCNQPIINGQIDHIMPVCKGGTNDRENLVWTCATCNQQKKDKSLLQFLFYRLEHALQAATS